MLHRELQKRRTPLADDFWQFCTDSYMFPLKQLLVIRNSIALVKMSMLFDQRHAAVSKGTQHRLQASSIHVILSGPPSVTSLVNTVVEGLTPDEECFLNYLTLYGSVLGWRQSIQYTVCAPY